MAKPENDLFGPEAGVEAERDEYEQLRLQLQELVEGFCEQHDLPFGMQALLLVDLGISARMVDYALSVDKPSASGLRLDLDRFAREIADFVRASKKSADQFIEASREALEQADKPEPE